MIAMRQMLDHAHIAMAFVEGRNRVDLETDRMFLFALVRAIEVIGEAAMRVPQDVRAGYPEIPWTQIIGARNRFIHGYDTIDPDILWDIAARDVRVLAQSLEGLLPPVSSSRGSAE